MKVGNPAVGAYGRSSAAGVGQAQATKSVGKADAKSGAESTSTEAASAHFSKEARALAGGKGGNEARIAELKDQVQQGKFQVDSSRVADRMLDALG